MDKKHLLLLCSIACFTKGYNLTETVELAKVHDPGYQSEQLALRSQTFADRIEASGFLPTIDFSIVGTHVAANHQTTSTSGKFKMDVALPLYDPKQISAYKKGLLVKEQALTELQQLNINHTLQTASNYFAALKAQAAYRAKKTALSHYEKSFNDAKKKEEAGLGTHIDTLTTKANLDTGSLELIVAKNNLNQSLNTLSNQVNTSIDSLSTFTDNTIPNLPIDNIEDIIEQAITKSTRIHIAKIKAAKARNTLSEASNHLLPSASLAFEQTQPLDTLEDHFFEQQYSSTKATLTLTMRAFSGFKDSLSAKQEKLSYLSAQAALDDERYTLQLDIKNAYRNYQSALLQAHAAHSALKSAEALLSAQQEKNQSGIVTELELMSAITQSSEAQNNFYSAVYDLLLNYLQIKAAASTLSETDIHNINQYLSTVSEFETEIHPS